MLENRKFSEERTLNRDDEPKEVAVVPMLSQYDAKKGIVTRGRFHSHPNTF